jgi:predicted lactoylglutathione lyase
MTVPPVISLVTLGVRDVVASTRFYEQLGFPRSSASVDGDVSFFHTAGGLLAIWGDEDLQHDAGAGELVAPGTFRGVALAINVDSEAAVDAALAAAEHAGARVVKPAAPTDWGGYQGYFTDPDEHHWEVAFNPGWPLGSNGLPKLPK